MNLREHIEEIISTPVETNKVLFYIRQSQIEQAIEILTKMNLDFKIKSGGFYTEICIDFGFCQKEIFHHIGL